MSRENRAMKVFLNLASHHFFSQAEMEEWVDILAPHYNVLLGFMGDPCPEIRETVRKVLAKVQDPKLAPMLIESAQSADWTVRYMALDIMGRKLEEAFLPSLVALLGDSEESIRDRAIEVLSQWRDSQWLEDAIGNRNIRIRLGAISAFKGNGAPEGLGTILNCLKDTDPEVVRAAQTVLIEYEAVDRSALFDGDPVVTLLETVLEQPHGISPEKVQEIIDARKNEGVMKELVESFFGDDPGRTSGEIGNLNPNGGVAQLKRELRLRLGQI